MRVNEIFYSLQGEGRFTGTPAVFLRLSGCNLKCSFCDTSHEDGVEMEPAEIIGEILKYPSRHIVITGGEPSLQLDRDFVERLHQHGYYVQVETNGVKRLPDNVDWITCSPKYKPICYDEVQEIKYVYEGKESEEKILSLFRSVRAEEHYLQPCDVNNQGRNAEILAGCIDFIKAHPEWKLSLQTHKILNIR